MAHLLEKWGVNVLEAESAESALDLIDELGILPDCFLVDHALGPGMDGLAFLQIVQARHRSVARRNSLFGRRTLFKRTGSLNLRVYKFADQSYY